MIYGLGMDPNITLVKLVNQIAFYPTNDHPDHVRCQSEA